MQNEQVTAPVGTRAKRTFAGSFAAASETVWRAEFFTQLSVDSDSASSEASASPVRASGFRALRILACTVSIDGSGAGFGV